LLSRGTSIDHVLETLIGRLRDLMVLCACGEKTELIEISGESRAEEWKLAQRFDAAGLVHMIALCENVQRAAKQSAVPRALFDALMVRLAMTEKLADVTAFVEGKGTPAQREIAAKKR
jgi:DNA polymerase III gamma/tau subunit